MDDKDRMINVLAAQREAALNDVARMAIQLGKANDRIAELETKLKELEPKE